MIAIGIYLLIVSRICMAFSDTITLFGQVINMDKWAYASIIFALTGIGILLVGVISFAWSYLP